VSEDRFKNIENELKDMRQAQASHHDDMLKVLLKLEHTISNIVSHDDEIKQLRRSVHDHGNRLTAIMPIEKRLDKIEQHNETQEEELKKSFKERDEKHLKLSILVYIGVGMAITFEFIARFVSIGGAP